uniref:Uncharacterized protein n=1 Tax=Romanomermis culicivorax TaxID=13658 RepID=A0A915K937_ROMCU
MTDDDDDRFGKPFKALGPRIDPKIGLRQLSSVGWAVEILSICSLSILSLQPDAIFGIVGAGLMSFAPKAWRLRNAGVVSACGSVKAVGVRFSRLRLVARALLPGIG